MQNILDQFLKKEPRYPNSFRDLIDRLSRKAAVDTSSGTDEEKFSQGKIFGNYYECFIYAVIVGMRQNYRLPLDRSSEGTKFYIIEKWSPRPLVEYIFMGLLALSDFDLMELEELDNEQQTDEKVLALIKLMEEYAHGGFDTIKSRLEEEPHLFSSPYGAVSMLKNLEPVHSIK